MTRLITKNKSTILREVINDFKLIWKQLFETPVIGTEKTDYNAYWKNKRKDGTLGIPGVFQMHRAIWILPRLQNGDKVAEFGCGDAATLIWLKEKIPIQGIGIDVSEYALTHAAGRGLATFRLEPQSKDLSALPESDVYLLLEVLEHLPDPEATLRQILEKTRKKVILSIPNTGYFSYRLRFLFGRFPVQWKIHPGEHVRFWTLDDFLWWLKQLGYYDKCSVSTYKGIPILKSILPNSFSMGILCEIRK